MGFMASVSSDAVFTAFVVIFLAIFTFLIKVAVDFGVMKTRISAAHKRLDKYNGQASLYNDDDN